MSSLQIMLLGKMEVSASGRTVASFGSAKADELFSYLVLNRDRPHPREALASLLWSDCTTRQSRAYLRKILWHLQQTFGSRDLAPARDALHVRSEWVELGTSDQIWIDVAELEMAFHSVRGRKACDLKNSEFLSLQSAANLYRSDLLENLYYGWCLQRRERLQYMYVAILDKLAEYCEVHQLYELGIDFCDRVLAIDDAREQTHCRLMTLRYLSGDRTGAIRQYERCKVTLREELDLLPSQNTNYLLKQIRGECLESVAGSQCQSDTERQSHLDRIRSLQRKLGALQSELENELLDVESAVGK
jgi:DNA-binding SARP family transcriptional activator